MRHCPVRFLVVVLFGCLSTTTPAQSSFDLAAGLELPKLNTKKLKPALNDRWRLEGYTLSFSNPFFGLGSDAAGRRVLVTRYPETDLATGYYTITAAPKHPQADGPAASLTPDGHSYRGGGFRQNLPDGPWLRVSADTLLPGRCPTLAFDTPREEIVERLSACYPEPALRRRIRIARASYRAGQLEGAASETLLSGDTLRVAHYRAGALTGEERVYDHDGALQYRVTHGATGSDTIRGVLPPSRPVMRVVEQMPAFRSPDCAAPTPVMTPAAHEEHKQCAERAMLQYIYEHIRYPKPARRAGFQGTAVVQFVVERDGSLTGVRSVRFVSESLDAEARRVVAEMPRWWPGYHDGEPARVQFVLPLAFRLE